MAKGHNNTGRSRSRRQKHVRLYHWMLDIPAYRSLNPTARALLVEFYALYNGSNNGEIFMSVREAGKRLGVSKETATKYIEELREKGFIKIRQKGSFDWKVGHATTWILTEFEFNGKLPTKDFAHWQPENEEKNPVQKNRTNGPKKQDRRSRLNGKILAHGPKNLDHRREVQVVSGPKI